MKGFPHRLNAITLGPAKSFSSSGRQRVRTRSTSCSVTFSSYVNSLLPGFSEKPLSHHCPEEKHPCWLPFALTFVAPSALPCCLRSASLCLRLVLYLTTWGTAMVFCISTPGTVLALLLWLFSACCTYLVERRSVDSYLPRTASFSL